jgi:predicted AlkP superfamily phosphohydrolase/phosphomutase
MLNRTGLTKLIQIIPIPIRDKINLALLKNIPKDENLVSRNALQKHVEWNNTTVLGLGEGPIYLNKNLLKEKYEETRDELIEKISSIKDPINNEKLARRVFRKEEIYFGEHTNRAPDLIILPTEGYVIKMDLNLKNQMWFYNSPDELTNEILTWKATHQLYGIFFAYGKNIKANYKIKGATIYDIFPTIMKIYGIKNPEDIDGHTLEEIFNQTRKNKIKINQIAA